MCARLVELLHLRFAGMTCLRHDDLTVADVPPAVARAAALNLANSLFVVTDFNCPCSKASRSSVSS